MTTMKYLRLCFISIFFKTDQYHHEDLGLMAKLRTCKYKRGFLCGGSNEILIMLRLS